MVFVILIVLIYPYFRLFVWMNDQRDFHKQFRNVFKVDKDTLRIDQAINNSAEMHDMESPHKDLDYTVNLDHDAYMKESPLPFQERLYLQYIRNRKKAELRRSDNSEDEENQLILEEAVLEYRSQRD